MPFGMAKLEWWGYTNGEKTDDILAISTEYRRVTDGRTRHLPTA